MTNFHQQALDYLSDATSQPQIVAKVARLMENNNILSEALHKIVNGRFCKSMQDRLHDTKMALIAKDALSSTELKP